MEHPLKNLGEILYPQLLARLLYLKYDFNIPENRQIRLLAREGVPYKQQHAEQLSP
ncbi:MAG: IS66 family transposase [Bacteroides uniformis]|jgi:transposase|uniref:IS66 family transposase n=1 Tax=Bacteroides TaxID=816 RepID=UPI001F00F0B6|nr:IS66 family transposase [Bacteroides uniformis]